MTVKSAGRLVYETRSGLVGSYSLDGSRLIGLLECAEANGYPPTSCFRLNAITKAL